LKYAAASLRYCPRKTNDNPMTTHFTRIADCAEVLPGYAFKSRTEHEPGGTHQVILGKHLCEGLPYRYLPDHELRVTPKGSLDKYRVEKGDVLFVSRGNRNCATVVESVFDPTVASATFYILRPHADIDPAYLAWCLNQAPIQTRIAQVRTGAGTPIIQRKIFAEIVLPVPPLEKQRKLAELGGLMARERLLRQQLVEQTNRLHRALGEKLLQQMTPEN
jgi:Type I restriction modification DNA specificity domain